MSRIISGSIWGLALAAMAAFSALPATAASIESGGMNGAHVVLVRGGGGGGGGHGGGGFGGGGGHSFGGGGFSGGGRSFGPAISGGTRSFSSPSFSQGNRSFSGNNFANGSRSFSGNNFANGNRGNFGHDGYNHGGWNNGNWAWRGNGYYRGWGGGWWGYPLMGWLGGYGWWYPGYYDYGSDYYPYYYGDNYAYADTAAPAYTAVEPQQENQPAEEGQGSEYLDEAIQSFQAGNFQNAMRLAEHAIVDSPRDAEAHEVVSLAAMANKDYRTAATEAHAVIALGGVPSWNQVYAIYQNVDTFTSQLRALEDYVKAHPKSAEGQFLLGVQYMTTGYSSDAHDHLAQAAQLTPKDKIAQDLVKGAGGEAPATANRPGGAETK